MGGNQYLTIFCDGKNRYSQPFHTNFGIGKNGETIYLFNPNGNLVDSLAVPAFRDGVSYDHQPNGSRNFGFFAIPTPEESNTTQLFSGWLEPPVFGLASGVYTSNQSTTISHPETGLTIQYEFGGITPGGTSPVYSGPVTFTPVSPGTSDQYTVIPTILALNYPFGSFSESRANTRGWMTPYTSSRKQQVLSAIAIKPGLFPSKPATVSYSINPAGNPFGLPILSLYLEPAGLFSDSTGIYVYGDDPEGNYKQSGLDWERSANINYVLPDGTPVMSREVGLRIHGGGGRHSALKTFRMYARSEYGDNNFNYPFFGETNGNQFRRLLVCSPGHRPDCILRDDISNLACGNLPLETAHLQHTALYINGEYWGLFSLKERLDGEQLEIMYGLDEEDIVILQGRGTSTASLYQGVPEYILEWEYFITYLDSADMTRDGAYDFAHNEMDLQNLIDYNISQTYLGNSDWPNNNVRYWKKRVTPDPSLPQGIDGRWRYLFYDLDGAFGGSCSNFSSTKDALEDAISKDIALADYTIVLRNMVKNDSFRVQFINRAADLMNTTFIPIRLDTMLDRLTDKLDPNMQDYVERWRYPSGVSTLIDRYQEVPSTAPWEDVKNEFEDFFYRRPENYREHVMQHLGPTDTSRITLNVNDYQMGEVGINTIRINPSTDGVEGPNPYPWQGVYFHDVPITAYAIPKPGYEFVR